MIRNTQRARVAQHLKTHKTITQHEAQQLFGVARLAAVILELRNAGYDIVTERTKCMNRYGERTHFATCILRAAPQA